VGFSFSAHKHVPYEMEVPLFWLIDLFCTFVVLMPTQTCLGLKSSVVAAFCCSDNCLLSRFDFSGKGNEELQEEIEEKRQVHVVSKLHAILRPFLLRRMKEDVEHMLPRKKEIIIYANMTEHQKQIQDHLVHRTFDNYLHEESDIGMLT
jgi:hypothetical protein